MKTIKLFFFTVTSGAVVGVYAVAPFAVSLRPVVGGLLMPAIIAVGIVTACAIRIVTVLRRAAPFADAASDLLIMPVVEQPRPLLPSLTSDVRPCSVGLPGPVSEWTPILKLWR